MQSVSGIYLDSTKEKTDIYTKIRVCFNPLIRKSNCAYYTCKPQLIVSI